MTFPHNQRGSTLLVALIMLVLLTLIAISAMSTTTTSIQVVGNAQLREEATAAAQRAIEVVLSDVNFRIAPPAPQSVDINRDGVADYTVNFNPVPRCIKAETAVPSLTLPGVCNPASLCSWTSWDIVANVTDITTGASIVVHQGVRILVGVQTVANFC